MLKSLIVGVIINTLMLVGIALWLPMGGFTITPISFETIPILLIMGLLFWLIFMLVKPILQFLTTPVNIITLGIASILLNFMMVYLFVYIVNALGFGITITLGTMQQTFILSIILSTLTLLLKKIL